jgi:glucose-1-phosphate thymidylyltransferase
MLHVAGKPILGHILDNLKRLKVSRIVVVLGSMSEPIMEFCRDYPYRFIFVKQKKRLGLGHAVYTGARGLKGATMVILGDTIIDHDLKAFAAGDVNRLAVKEVSEPRRFGIVEVAEGSVISVAEKPDVPKSNLAITGLYYFTAIEKVHRAIAYTIRKGIKTKNEYQLTDGLSYLLKCGERFRISMIKHWFDCGTPEALIDTNRHLLRKVHYYRKRRRVVVIAPVFIPDSADVSDSLLGPYVSIGENARIKQSIIIDSIINSDALLEGAMLSRSIVGENAVVRGNFKKLNVGDSSMIEFP